MHAFVLALIPVTEKGRETLPPGATTGTNKIIGPISRAGSTLSLYQDTSSVNWLVLIKFICAVTVSPILIAYGMEKETLRRSDLSAKNMI